MIAALLGAALLTQTAPEDITTFGGDLLTSAACASLGWAVDQAEITRLGQALDAAHPDLTSAQIEGFTRQAGEARMRAMGEEIALVRSRAQARDWLVTMDARCAGLAAARPALMTQSAESGDLRAAFVARFPD